MKTFKNIKTLALILVLVTALCIALAGCSSEGKGTFGGDIYNETGFITEPDDAGEGTAVMGHLTVAEGDVVLIDSELTKGELHINVLEGVIPEDGGDEVLNVIFSHDINSAGKEYFELDPGEYDMGVTVTGNGATGTVKIYPVPAADIEALGDDAVLVKSDVIEQDNVQQ
jgi:hypothetical protein